MTAHYAAREDYRLTPRYPLRAIGVSEQDYVAGPLEDWTEGALRLDGRGQHLVLAHASLRPPEGLDPAASRTVDMEQNDFVIEAVFSTGSATGLVAGKMGPRAGYALELHEGRPALRLRLDGVEQLTTAKEPIHDARFRHLLVEVDRAAATVTMYLDGRRIDTDVVGLLGAGSLANDADFLVGGGPGTPSLAATFDFLRVARGTLAAARTTIEELHAWQFDGPQFRDFAGARREPGRSAAGALVTPLR